MPLLNKIKSIFGSDQESCQAIRKDSGKQCKNKVYGRGCTQGHNIKFCSRHIPSESIPFGGRVSSVKFYIPEDDVTIEVN